ncbi:hypothetical protein [Streptomyces albogriseolus]|uniref:hypothetical protein n=1 Tax=Streptomyces albogriseolus TaxID=1887 RepID=UPI00345FAB88
MHQEHQGDNPTHSNSATLISELGEIYGFRFVRFVLALPEPWEVGDAIGSQQSDVANVLYSWYQAVQDMDPPNRWINLTTLATRRMVSDKQSNASFLRSLCGGRMEVPRRENDDVFNVLAEYARDVYPAFLIDRPGEGKVPQSPFATPDEQGGNLDFYRAVLRDAQLKYLFPEELSKDPEALDREALYAVRSLVYFEVGQGGTFQLPLLAFSLLNSAYSRCVVAGDDSFDAYIAAVAQNLSDARSLGGWEGGECSADPRTVKRFYLRD